MKEKQYATLRRRPFLTPIWLSAIAALVVISVMVWLWGTATSTTIIVLRHAERALDAGPDPDLTPAGDARAQALARLFGADGGPGRIQAIIVSPTRRSRETAAPLAARLHLTPKVLPGDNPRMVARHALREYPGGRVLIVAHADTIPAIVEDLTGWASIPAIRSDEYGTIYVVTVPHIGRAGLLRLDY